MRLDKFLADCGIGTRTEIKKYIKAGRVCVSGHKSLKPDLKIDELKDDVFFDEKKVVYKKFVYLMLNKPQDYISAVWDNRNKCVVDLVPEEYLHYDVYPVGRLDIDTEGLLILTNDGELTHKLLSPKYEINKMYFAEISGVVTEDDCERFKEGVVLDDGYKAKPAKLEILSSGESSKIKVSVTEGKFHQVKRMFEAVGKKVTYLKRLSMNELSLDETLKLGEVKELSENELTLLKKGLD